MALTSSPEVSGTLVAGTGVGTTGTITLNPNGTLPAVPAYQVVTGNTPSGGVGPGSTIGTGSSTATLTPSVDGLSCVVTGATSGTLVILITVTDPTGANSLYQEVDVTVSASGVLTAATNLGAVWTSQ